MTGEQFRVPAAENLDTEVLTMADRAKAKEKAKSRVNEAGNYTKPGLRKSIFNRIKAGGKGGKPWSVVCA